MASNFQHSQIDPASGTFGRRNAARYVGGTVAGESHATVKSYLIGFVLSIILTAIPFALVMDQLHYGFSAQTVFAAILVLAVVQVFVHVVYFLHMDRSAEQRWNVVAFTFTVFMLAIVVAGSIWIMHNATSNMEHHMDSEAVVPQR
jgi:cytochrome o ubiquinol oxidase operon protein cyoD